MNDLRCLYADLTVYCILRYVFPSPLLYTPLNPPTCLPICTYPRHAPLVERDWSIESRLAGPLIVCFALNFLKIMIMITDYLLVLLLLSLIAAPTFTVIL